MVVESTLGARFDVNPFRDEETREKVLSKSKRNRVRKMKRKNGQKSKDALNDAQERSREEQGKLEGMVRAETAAKVGSRGSVENDIYMRKTPPGVAEVHDEDDVEERLSMIDESERREGDGGSVAASSTCDGSKGGGGS